MLAGTTVMRTLEPGYRRFRAELCCGMTRVASVDQHALAVFILDHGIVLPVLWDRENPENHTPSPQDYELFLRRQYLKGMGFRKC